MNGKSNCKKKKKKNYGPLRMRTVHLPEKKLGFDKWYICKEENIDIKIMGV